MKLVRLSPAVLSGLSLWSVLIVAPYVCAQTPPASSSALKKTVKSTPKSPNVKSGELVALNGDEGTIQIKEKLGKTAVYAITDKTRFLKGKQEAELTAFKPGEAVVVHIRKARDGGDPQATEVADKASWAWMEDVKRNMTEAVITALDDEELTVIVGAEKIPLTYKVSDKTTWSRSGKPASAADFKVGDKIVVVIRSTVDGVIRFELDAAA